MLPLRSRSCPSVSTRPQTPSRLCHRRSSTSPDHGASVRIGHPALSVCFSRISATPSDSTWLQIQSASRLNEIIRRTLSSCFYACRYRKTAAHFCATCIRAANSQVEEFEPYRRSIFLFEHRIFPKTVPTFGSDALTPGKISSGSADFADRAFQDVERFVHDAVLDGDRRQEADDVAVDAAGRAGSAPCRAPSA